jgi:hypothetical protein
VVTAGPDEAPEHRLSWREGDLVLDAHPDPEAEEALGALGGERCACLDVFDAWRGASVDGAVLTVGARHLHDAVRPPTATLAELRAELRRWRATSGSLVEEARLARDTRAIDRLVAVAGPAERRAGKRLAFLLLLSLDATLLRRLQAEVAARVAADESRRPQLTAATAARALPALSAIGWSGTLRDVRLGDEPRVGPSDAVLPPTWLSHVWGRGLESSVAGALVVDVTEATSDGRFGVVGVEPGKSGVASRVGPVGE